MTSISFRGADGLLLDVRLQRETVTLLISQLRIVSPILADKVEEAVLHTAPVQLEDEEVEFLAAAARLVSKNDRIDESELERIAALV